MSQVLATANARTLEIAPGCMTCRIASSNETPNHSRLLGKYAKGAREKHLQLQVSGCSSSRLTLAEIIEEAAFQSADNDKRGIEQECDSQRKAIEPTICMGEIL
ncbi:hypothetical protein CERZMDRAFT_90719 [Cercospora zeae-maydis SCOH1-5]|uniref:Uncharacterized protein n=1 Tax=Cercospora zeae-maydis SCOH1-5 TaxID=717836 RepID=A0A6A6FFQ1_9PEZI|nr:hypothetical protein CERZMDRAFT_90719 [Cercospora zeae-maydis SCOH1-5]